MDTARTVYSSLTNGIPSRAAALSRGLTLLVALGCALSFGGLPAVGAGPVLFYLERQPKAGCAAKTRDFATKQDAVLFKAGSCPSSVLWDKPHGRLLAVVGGHLSSYPLTGVLPANPLPGTNLGALPAPELTELWVDKGTGKLRAAYLVAVPDEDVVTRGNPAKGGSVAYRYGGKSYDATRLDAVDGFPQIAVLSELEGAKWMQVKAAATKTGAGEAPGISVLGRRERSADVWSLEAAMDAMTCSGTTKGVSPNCEDEGAQAKAALGNQDGYGSLDLGNGRKAVFPVIMGDTPHATGPVVLCAPECKPSGKLKGTESRNPQNPAQYGLAAKAGLLLIVGENRDLPVRVFDEHGNKVLELPKATVAAWWPQ